MKVRNLLFATAFACTLAACSNDEIPGTDDGKGAELDATLTIAYNIDGATQRSKAVTDADITTIGIAVFNRGAMTPAMADGALISYAQIERNGVDTTACVSAKSGDVKVIVVANPGENLARYTTLTAFQQAISARKMSSQVNGDLLMASQTYDMTLVAGRNIACTSAQKETIDWTSQPAQFITSSSYKVYRNVARVKLGKITVKPRKDFGETAQYAKLTIKKVFVDYVRPKVLVCGDNATDWNTVNFISKNEEDKLFLTGNTPKSPLGVEYSEGSYPFIEYTSGDASQNLDIPFYVFDNATMGNTPIGHGFATRLVVQGTYEYKTGNADDENQILKSEDAYWYFEINNNDASVDYTGGVPAHQGVLRNVEYVVNMVVTGPGEGELPNPIDPTDPEDPDVPTPVDPNPDEPTDGKSATLTVAVTVANWGYIEQHPSID